MGSAIRDRNMQMKQKKTLSESKNRTSSTNWSWGVNALQSIDNAASLPTSDQIAVDAAAAAAAAIEPLATCCTLLWRSAENKVVYY